jgi:ABC-type Fe3+ transport system substrate-binding protein
MLAQGLIVLSHSKRKKEAEKFVDFVKSKDSGDVLTKFGFTLPLPPVAQAPLPPK